MWLVQTFRGKEVSSLSSVELKMVLGLPDLLVLEGSGPGLDWTPMSAFQSAFILKFNSIGFFNTFPVTHIFILEWV